MRLPMCWAIHLVFWSTGSDASTVKQSRIPLPSAIREVTSPRRQPTKHRWPPQSHEVPSPKRYLLRGEIKKSSKDKIFLNDIDNRLDSDGPTILHFNEVKAQDTTHDQMNENSDEMLRYKSNFPESINTPWKVEEVISQIFCSGDGVRETTGESRLASHNAKIIGNRFDVNPAHPGFFSYFFKSESDNFKNAIEISKPHHLKTSMKSSDDIKRNFLDYNPPKMMKTQLDTDDSMYEEEFCDAEITRSPKEATVEGLLVYSDISSDEKYYIERIQLDKLIPFNEHGNMETSPHPESVKKDQMILGSKRIDEGDKRIAIESIERYQKQASKLDEEFSMTLNHTIAFLENFGNESRNGAHDCLEESNVKCNDGMVEKSNSVNSFVQKYANNNMEKSCTSLVSKVKVVRSDGIKCEISEDEYTNTGDDKTFKIMDLKEDNLLEESGLAKRIATPSDIVIQMLQETAQERRSNRNFYTTATNIHEHTGHGNDTARRRGVLHTQGGRIPFCDECKQEIRGAYVLANGLTYCPDHFVCANKSCGRKLLEIGFVEDKGRKYCERCFETQIAPRCAKCSHPITADCLNALQKQWHPHCFVCAHCHKPFGNSAFFLEQGQPYCEADWNALFTTKCVSCHYPIEAGDRWVEALGAAFHSNCFNCTSCNVNLEGESFYAKDGAPYCKLHA